MAIKLNLEMYQTLSGGGTISAKADSSSTFIFQVNDTQVKMTKAELLELMSVFSNIAQAKVRAPDGK